ncbi:MAG: hypothetical protein BWX95_02440 [Bacteroidetes bacterium ADurb.Bin141]|nr:MAG: hypothetical protein BWX95_02440 [Bacteroidetes bacterium ADurb.Bin141]
MLFGSAQNLSVNTWMLSDYIKEYQKYGGLLYHIN